MQANTMIEERLADIRAQIDAALAKSARSSADVSMLAAVKYLPPEDSQALVDAGITEFAENRWPTLKQRKELVIDPSINWHFIGRLQSKEIARIARNVGMIHSVWTESSVERLSALEPDVRPQLLLQVNTANDPAKDGLAPDSVEPFLERLPDNISIYGLMTMPAFTADAEDSRTAFADLRNLRDKLSTNWGKRHPMQYLSMGTSQDFAVAVEEGATHIRLGRILLPERE